MGISRFPIKVRMDPSNFLLYQYADMPFDISAKDAYDRFAISLGQRCTHAEITKIFCVATL